MTVLRFEYIATFIVVMASVSCHPSDDTIFSHDGIYIRKTVKDRKYVSISIRSENVEYDCINISGITGDNEDLVGNIDNDIINKSERKYSSSEITMFDNKPEPKIMNLDSSFKKIEFNFSKYNYVMFPIFNCENFRKNLDQIVYIYTDPKKHQM